MTTSLEKLVVQSSVLMDMIKSKVKNLLFYLQFMIFNDKARGELLIFAERAEYGKNQKTLSFFAFQKVSSNKKLTVQTMYPSMYAYTIYDIPYML